jgi:hypothetical protein
MFNEALFASRLVFRALHSRDQTVKARAEKTPAPK